MTNKNTQSRPIKTAGYSFAKQRARRNIRRVEAKARLQAYYDMPPENKINRAVLRRGGSRRELTFLRNSLALEMAGGISNV